MTTAREPDRLNSMADIRRAAWFARLAFGAPSTCIDRVPMHPQKPRRSLFRNPI